LKFRNDFRKIVKDFCEYLNEIEDEKGKEYMLENMDYIETNRFCLNASIANLERFVDLGDEWMDDLKEESRCMVMNCGLMLKLLNEKLECENLKKLSFRCFEMCNRIEVNRKKGGNLD